MLYAYAYAYYRCPRSAMICVRALSKLRLRASARADRVLSTLRVRTPLVCQQETVCLHPFCPTPQSQRPFRSLAFRDPNNRKHLNQQAERDLKVTDAHASAPADDSGHERPRDLQIRKVGRLLG